MGGRMEVEAEILARMVMIALSVDGKGFRILPWSFFFEMFAV